MPAALHRQHLLPAGHLPRQVEGVLVGLGAGVGEEDRRERRRHPGHQLLRQFLPVGMRQHGGVEQQLLRLLRNRRHHVRVAVASGCHGVAAIGVEPALALVVSNPRAAARHRTHRHLGVNREQRRGAGGVGQHGNTPTAVRPAVSSKPSARFMAWTACPPAPFTRLSSATITCSSRPSSESAAWIRA